MFSTCVATTRKFRVKHKQQDLYFLKKRPDSNQPSKKRQTKQLRNFSCEKNYTDSVIFKRWWKSDAYRETDRQKAISSGFFSASTKTF